MAKPDINRGIKIFRAFNEREPEFLDKIHVPVYDILVKIGPCTHIAYLADDGKNYMHKFKVRSRPLLTATDDGKHLVLVGGRFEFGGRGIVDK